VGLGRRQLNRALLARQLLLERARLPLPQALERVAGIQAQYAPSTYIGLWTRLEGFERDTLTAALEDRSVVQGTLMRTTIHLVSPADYWPFAIATRDVRRAQWLRNTDLDDAAMTAAARTLEAELDGSPMRRADVEALIGKEPARAIHNWIDLVRAPPSGTWERRRADLYAAARDWLGDPPAHDEAAAMEHLVRRYLAAFGPASRKDIQIFTGLSLTTLTPVLERIGPEELGDDLLDLPAAPRPDPDTPAPPRYLPTFDATLLVHARRTQILPEHYRARIFNTKTPHSRPTFLVDGAVAGTWAYEDGRVVREEFELLDAADRRALDDEGERLATLLAP
jgi:Winged helix DNA-binding domain